MLFDLPATPSQILHWSVGALLTLSFLFFLGQFLVPGWKVGNELRRAQRRLEELKNKGPVLDLDELREHVMKSAALRHCWDEYQDTLHGQKSATAQGRLEVVRWRATTMANGFFTEQTLVDAPLRTEFYKHLPGILTGLGIIGTFTGLIIGLQGFKVSDDASVVRGSLETLIVSVGGAFVVSGIAIGLAMLVTTIEKFVVNRRYTEIERFCGLIDSLFDAGVGEEYLKQLVDAAETSATQAMQMKESLVTDLKQVLTELTNHQIESMSASNARLAQSIGASINEGLKDPLDRISVAVQSVGANQGEAVNKLLTDVLSGFASQMETMFGSQLRGMSEMLVQTASTIQATSQRFEQLASRIEQAGSGAVETMAARMDDALRQMQTRQSEANDQMRTFIEDLRTSVARGQSESADLTLGMMKELSESTGELIRTLRDQAHSDQEAHAQRQSEITGQTAAFLEQQGDQLKELIQALQSSTDAMNESVADLKKSTNSSVERMALSSERMLGSANRLSDNLEAMKAASDGVVGAADKLIASTNPLTQSLAAVQQVLADQKSARDAFQAMVTELRSTVENAKREASITGELVQTLDSASQRLSQAQSAANDYLDEVTEVLAATHQAFAREMTATLRDGNSKFHEELAQAVGLLKSGIQELSDALDNLPSTA
jgi:ABC-type transporter Mla subunit MlaD